MVVLFATGYSLVIICSGLNEEKSTVISKLHLYRRPYGVSPDPTKYRKYLENHFVSEHQPSYQELYGMRSVPYFPASVVDRNGYEVVGFKCSISIYFSVGHVSGLFLQVEPEWARHCSFLEWLKNSRL